MIFICKRKGVTINFVKVFSNFISYESFLPVVFKCLIYRLNCIILFYFDTFFAASSIELSISTTFTLIFDILNIAIKLIIN